MKKQFDLEKQFPIFSKIFEKTIASELPGVKAMTEEESWEWHKKHAKINEDGTMTISSDVIGDGSYEKKYKAPYKRIKKLS